MSIYNFNFISLSSNHKSPTICLSLLFSYGETYAPSTGPEGKDSLKSLFCHTDVLDKEWAPHQRNTLVLQVLYCECISVQSELT